MDKSCTTRKQDLLNGALMGGQYGEWMRAENVKTMRRSSNDDREHERKTPLSLLAESKKSSENGRAKLHQKMGMRYGQENNTLATRRTLTR